MPTHRVPDGLRWWAGTPVGAAWLDRLPRLVAECAERWELRLGAPLAGRAAYVARAVRADGVPVVLKLNFPDSESEHEAAALAHWNGSGAVRLLAADAERRALLLERCEPGTPVAAADVGHAAPGVLRALRRRPPPPDHPFTTLAGAAPGWARTIDELGVEPALARRALGWLDALVTTQAEPVVLHQDLHAGNVLRRGGEWVAIDPKPIVGEPAFDLVALGRNRPDAPWLARVASAAGVDPERARRWAVVHALAWARLHGRVLPEMVAAARALSAGG